MRGREGRRGANDGRPIIAKIGLLLMVGSFVWLQLTATPRSMTRLETRPTENAPFALVVIDPGHGGKDSGTIQTGLVEKDLALDVAQRLSRHLQMRGFVTVLTRADDSFISLAERATIANNHEGAVFVSIHFDEAGRTAASGIETYYAAHRISLPERVASWLPFMQKLSTEPPDLESENLAGFIQESAVAQTQAANRGTRQQQFFVVANVRHPAVLVEGGFLTNKDEAIKLTNADYRDQMAAGIADGIVNYRASLVGQNTPLAVELPSR
jgi:N-acetylmuramoyl-L-alanine amidase